MPNDPVEPKTNSVTITIVIVALAINATIALSCLGFCLVRGISADQVLLTAFIGLAGTLFGYLAGVLGRTTPTSATSPSTTQDVKVTNTPTEPVPTQDQ